MKKMIIGFVVIFSILASLSVGAEPINTLEYFEWKSYPCLQFFFMPGYGENGFQAEYPFPWKAEFGWKDAPTDDDPGWYGRNKWAAASGPNGGTFTGKLNGSYYNCLPRNAAGGKTAIGIRHRWDLGSTGTAVIYLIAKNWSTGDTLKIIPLGKIGKCLEGCPNSEGEFTGASNEAWPVYSTFLLDPEDFPNETFDLFLKFDVTSDGAHAGYFVYEVNYLFQESPKVSILQSHVDWNNQTKDASLHLFLSEHYLTPILDESIEVSQVFVDQAHPEWRESITEEIIGEIKLYRCSDVCNVPSNITISHFHLREMGVRGVHPGKTFYFRFRMRTPIGLGEPSAIVECVIPR